MEQQEQDSTSEGLAKRWRDSPTRGWSTGKGTALCLRMLCCCRKRDVPSGAETVDLQQKEGVPEALLVSPSTREKGFWASGWCVPVQAASLLRAFCPCFPSWQHCLLWGCHGPQPVCFPKFMVTAPTTVASDAALPRGTLWGGYFAPPLTGYKLQPEISQSFPAPGSCSSGQADPHRTPGRSGSSIPDVFLAEDKPWLAREPPSHSGPLLWLILPDGGPSKHCSQCSCNLWWDCVSKSLSCQQCWREITSSRPSSHWCCPCVPVRNYQQGSSGKLSGLKCCWSKPPPGMAPIERATGPDRGKDASQGLSSFETRGQRSSLRTNEREKSPCLQKGGRRTLWGTKER